jgi:hypothetical protein
MKNIFDYLMPAKCKNDFVAAKQKSDAVCENVICLFDRFKGKIIHEVATPHARPVTIRKFQA